MNAPDLPTDENAAPKNAPVGTLFDLVKDVKKGERLDIEVAIKDGGRVIVFHSHPFKQPLAWFEFNLGTRKLNFVLDDGQSRDTNLPIYENVAAHMQNAHQILTVQMDPQTGEAVMGDYVPLILHQD